MDQGYPLIRFLQRLAEIRWMDSFVDDCGTSTLRVGMRVGTIPSTKFLIWYAFRDAAIGLTSISLVKTLLSCAFPSPSSFPRHSTSHQFQYLDLRDTERKQAHTAATATRSQYRHHRDLRPHLPPPDRAITPDTAEMAHGLSDEFEADFRAAMAADGYTGESIQEERGSPEPGDAPEEDEDALRAFEEALWDELGSPEDTPRDKEDALGSPAPGNAAEEAPLGPDDDLFGEDKEPADSPMSGDPVEQGTVLPAASQGQGIATWKEGQPTGLALPKPGLPKLPAPKVVPPEPTPAAAAEKQTVVVSPVLNGRVEKRRPKGKNKVAYPGAQVPGQNAEQVRSLLAAADNVLGIPSEEDLLASEEEVRALIDSQVAALGGDEQVQAAPVAQASNAAGNGLNGPASPPIDLSAPEIVAAVRQRKPRTPKPRQPAKSKPAKRFNVQPVPEDFAVPEGPIQPALDDIDLAVQRGKWGVWNPKGFLSEQYVLGMQCPYDVSNPRDIYDYLQAVIVSAAVDWPNKQHRRPVAAALFWMDQAWRRLCDAMIAQQAKFPWLPEHFGRRRMEIWEWVERRTLLGNPFAERDVDSAMAVLGALSRCQEVAAPPPPPQQGNEVVFEREVIVID